MKQFLLGFLVLVILTPVVVCACPADAPSSAAHQETGHHHDSGDHQGKDQDKNKSRNCVEASPQITPEVATLHAPDLKKDILVFAWADEKFLWSPALVTDNAIRGPPPDWPGLSKTQPSILLTTQRLRI